jgi:hypothetical protein
MKANAFRLYSGLSRQMEMRGDAFSATAVGVGFGGLQPYFRTSHCGG